MLTTLLACNSGNALTKNEISMKNNNIQLDTATFGSGCYWCTEAIFQRVRGVKSIVSGYSGGARPSPNCDQVSSGASGHAEVIQITYDPAEVTFEVLLEIF